MELTPGFFFEISDKIIPVYLLYAIYVTVGLMGFGLGFVRWWLGVIWLLGPMSLVLLAYGTLQYEEINDLYRHVIRELGHNYIVHNLVAPILGTLLNATGVGFGLSRRRSSSQPKLK